MKSLAFAISLCAAVSAFAGPPENSGVIACYVSTSRKLDSIIIPKIELRDVTVSEAIEFLRKKSQQLDPEGVGVNIVLMLPAEPQPRAIAPQPAAGAKGGEPRPKVTPKGRE